MSDADSPARPAAGLVPAGRRMRRPYLAAAWFIARADTLRLMRHRETLLWLVVMPVLFCYFFGTIGANMAGSGARRDTLALRGGRDGGLLVDELIRRLEAENYAIVRPGSPEEFATFARRLTIPGEAGFTDAVLAGQQQTILFERRGDPISGGYDQVRVARAVYQVLGDLAAVRMAGDEPTRDTFDALRAMPRALTIDSTPAGRRLVPPSGFEQAVPGTMVMFTMLVLLTSGAVSLVVERRQGLLRRLASAPISPGSLVLGKWIGRMMLGLIQITVAMAAGSVLFGMKWGAMWPMVVVVLLAWGAVNASLAVVLGSLARTEGQTIGIGVLASQLFAAFGGCWWPIEITPEWLQTVSLFLPSGWAMAAMHRLISFGDGAAAALPHLTALIATAGVLGWLGAKVFRYQ